MRYLGSKDKLMPAIQSLLCEKELVGHNLTYSAIELSDTYNSGRLLIDAQGYCLRKESIPETHKSFIRNSILTPKLSCDMLSDDFLFYLSQRNQTIALNEYCVL